MSGVFGLDLRGFNLLALNPPSMLIRLYSVIDEGQSLDLFSAVLPKVDLLWQYGTCLSTFHRRGHQRLLAMKDSEDGSESCPGVFSVRGRNDPVFV